ncbi:Type II/IV secretion system ATP hydrolase TadA/VirB11/CpaF, TadA subfamily [Pacificimonas flava]|uniref:Type II/IV secretion system ATP hydrolase TadA/VirB11/CpaF, TadA subfamily n=1 Tax=Pacificimonas flava TaxID=1234595 RepID=M2TNB3_9SPHN|nr:Type II/IV secretion system ATP hydrolase TadA/VirB11/CpaF, TadA subfamily [Pacificimonas flava]
MAPFGTGGKPAAGAPAGPRDAAPNPHAQPSLVIQDLSAAAQEAGSAQAPRGRSTENCVWELHELISPQLLDFFPRERARKTRRGELAARIDEVVRQMAGNERRDLSDSQARDTVTVLLNELLAKIGGLEPGPANRKTAASSASAKSVIEAKEKIQPLMMERIDASVIAELERGELAEQVSDVVSEIMVEQRMSLNTKEQRDLVTLLLNDMLGLGPLEPLLADDDVSEIMVNGPKTIYAERKGKLGLTDVQFRDDAHLLNIAQRIVSAVGRRVDETSPICDARLLDGSRVNVVIPPLAIDGASISIRKFSKDKLTLEKMQSFGSFSAQMAKFLNIAGRIKLNILISGGTGSGKTTMLNAISRNIDPGERIVTIEDAAELQLQQPHVVRLETRPANLEGKGEVNMRDLVKNALRMRPDRIILGEVRGPEAFELLAAMNTGHDGSLGTLHANRPREAITRLENMINMAGLNLPAKAIRTQIADALNLVVQISRMRDGGRRITHISEVVGMEGEVITMQDLFVYKYAGEDDTGKLRGTFESTGLRPACYERAEYFGLGRVLMECVS